MAEALQRRVLHGAMAGENVRRAQLALRDLKLDPGPVDGVYGPRTAQAVRRFQRAHGLHADGLVGPETWKRLAELPEGEPLGGHRLREALFGAVSGNDVHKVQRDLRDLGYDPGELDGIYGPDTERAVRAFQRSVGLPSDGLVGAQTRERLDAEIRLRGEPVDGPTTMETGNTRAPTRLVYAGYSPDSPAQQDQLGVQDLVDVLCSVVAAEDLQPPLALGLFGPWGSGKSFFMRQMKERIATLAERSAVAASEGRPTSYCAHIIQVDFNAWLYADADLWASLAAEVFGGVAEITGATQQDAPTVHDLKVEADDEKERLREELREISYQLERLRRVAPRRRKGARRQGGAAGTGTSHEGGSRFGRVGEAWRLLSGWNRLLVTATAGAALVLAVLAIVDASAARAVSAATGSVLAVAATVGTAIRGLTRTLEADEEKLEKRRVALQGQLVEKEKDSEKAGAVLEAVSADLVLPMAEYAAQQAAFWAQRERLSVVTDVRKRFLRLSDFIEESRKTRRNGDDNAAPLDRVIVYIDDLDRCPGDGVVHVLEAIKLLMDLPHFVVVAGVDSGWLLAALEQWLHALASSGRADRAPGVHQTATPEDYLEKIFQYSVRLPPMTSDGYARLITSLFPPPEARPSGNGHVPAANGHPPATPGGDEAGAEEPGAVMSDVGDAPVVGAPVDDLTPSALTLSDAELAFMSGLGPLIRTPRAAKRLANVYRLLRVAVGEDALLQDSQYEIVLSLLAAVIGAPRQVTELFQQLDADDTSAADAWNRYVSGLPPSATSVAMVREGVLSTVRKWVPVVDSYSFRQWREPSPERTSDLPAAFATRPAAGRR